MSDLILVESKPQQETLPQYKHLRKFVREWLRFLMLELAHYEQTTHGSLGNADLRDVLEALQTMYVHPSAYNISELDQRLGKWLKETT